MKGTTVLAKLAMRLTPPKMMKPSSSARPAAVTLGSMSKAVCRLEPMEFALYARQQHAAGEDGGDGEGPGIPLHAQALLDVEGRTAAIFTVDLLLVDLAQVDSTKAELAPRKATIHIQNRAPGRRR